MGKLKISDNDISVIVQGPIYYETMFSKNCTNDVILSIRRLLPNAEIILSTWKGEKTDIFDTDIVIENEDPGTFYMDYGIVMDNGSSLTTMNINRQIVSTVNGIKAATRRFVIKMRTDTILEGTEFLNHFIQYNRPVSKGYKDVLKHRVLALSATNPRLAVPQPFYVCDFFFFGYKEDVLKVWDIPLIDDTKLKLNDKGTHIGYYENYGAEQFLWLGFLRKYQDVKCDFCQDISENAIKRSEESFASYCILLPAHKAGVSSLKIGKAGYMARPSAVGLYTYDDWKKMYNKYCDGDERIYFYYTKKAIYLAEYYGKRILKKRFKKIFMLLKKIMIRV